MKIFNNKLNAIAALILFSTWSLAGAATYVLRVPAVGIRPTEAAQAAPAAPAATYAFSGATFTPCGATNNTGPTLTQCKTAYSSYAWAANSSYFNVGSGATQGFQYWTVPQTGNYTLTVAGAAGAAGRYFAGGNGAVVRGTVALNQGDTLTLVVGQAPATVANATGGGGGGTFVYKGSSVLMAAGGGGGGADYATASTASTTTAGTSTSGGIAVGSFGAGGAGVGSAGANASTYATGGATFSGGFVGGASTRPSGYVAGAGYGGFGGGGGACACNNGGGGGGGGYGGGNGGQNTQYYGGTPGTSYLGTSGLFTGSTNSGNGYITISAAQ